MSESSGENYKQEIMEYLFKAYGRRGLEIYSEVKIGTSIIGKNRSIDIVCYERLTGKALGIECKFQGSQGTADEKIPYALRDIELMPMTACIAYAGEGWSPGVLHMLQASQFATCCEPNIDEHGMSTNASNTTELDHFLAMYFGWWDIVLGSKNPYPLNKISNQAQVDLIDEFLAQHGLDEVKVKGRTTKPESVADRFWNYLLKESDFLDEDSEERQALDVLFEKLASEISD